MSTDNNDMYADDGAQRVDTPPVVPKDPPGMMENIMAMRHNKSAKRGLILSSVAVLGVVITIIILVARINNPPAPALPPEIQGVNVGGAPGSFRDEKQGGVGNTQQFEEMVAGVEQQRQTEAQTQQTSVQPLAIGVERALQPTPIQAPPVAQQQPYVSPVYQTTAPQQQDPAYTAMLQNARMALATMDKPPVYGSLIFDAPTPQTQQGGAPQAGQPAFPAPGASPAPTGNAQVPVTMIAAGKIESVRLDTAVNSDVGGEFVGTLLTGPYAGSRMIGTADRVGTLVKPQFTVMSLPNTGISVPVTALGLDPKTLENGTATDVDRKLFTKYGVQPLAAALSAVGQAIANAGGTTVITGDSTVVQSPELTSKRINGVAVGAAAQTFSKDVSGMSTDPTVRIAPGTIIGVVFTRDVVYTPR